MKKIIILLMTMIALLVSCQVKAQEQKSKTLSPAQTYFVDATDIDLSTTGDSSVYYTFSLNKKQEQLYDFQVNLDSVSGTPNYTVQLFGRLFDSDSWSGIGSPVEWEGTSADTTIKITEHTTAVFYRQLQARIIGQAGTGDATVDIQEIKVWDE